MKEEFDIDSISSSLDFESNSLVECGKGIYLTNYEISVLDRYGINYKKCTNLKEILYYIEDILNENSTIEELESISLSISERDYYLNTNK